MAQNETSGGISLEALLAAARSEDAQAPAEPTPEPATQAEATEGAKTAPEQAPSAEAASSQSAPAASGERAPEPTTAASSSGFDLAAALGYTPGSAPRSEAAAAPAASAPSSSSSGFDLAAALGYSPSRSAADGAEAAPAAVNPEAMVEAMAREEKARAAADAVAQEAIERAARHEDDAPRYRSRYADLPTRGGEGRKERAKATRTDSQSVSRMASASAQAAQAASEAQAINEAPPTQTSTTAAAPVTFKAAKPAAEAKEQPAAQTARTTPVAKQEAAPQPSPEPDGAAKDAAEEPASPLGSSEPMFMSAQEAYDRAAARVAEEKAAEEAAKAAAAAKAAEEEAARQAAALAAQQQAAREAQAQLRAAAAAQPAAPEPVQPSRKGSPRKAKVTATEEVMVSPLPTQKLGTISYEDAVFAEETRQLETATERKAAKKARRYRRMGTFLIIVAILAAVGALALFLAGTANASEDIESKAAEISEQAGRTITYRYRAADANGTLCPTTEVATFSTGGVLEQSVITMQTGDFETAGRTLANFKKQFQDSAYVDGRVDGNSVVFTLHLSNEHLMKPTYTALMMTNTVGCEVAI